MSIKYLSLNEAELDLLREILSAPKPVDSLTVREMTALNGLRGKIDLKPIAGIYDGAFHKGCSI